jgi:hypothetical protein
MVAAAATGATATALRAKSGFRMAAPQAIGPRQDLNHLIFSLYRTGFLQEEPRLLSSPRLRSPSWQKALRNKAIQLLLPCQSWITLRTFA